MKEKHLNRGGRRGRPNGPMGGNSGTVEWLSYLQLVPSKARVGSMWVTKKKPTAPDIFCLGLSVHPDVLILAG